MSDAGAKSELRRSFAAARRAMNEDDRRAARAAICSTVLEMATTSGWRCVAGYVPLASEPGSVEVLDGLRGLGCRVLTPVTLSDHDLDWTTWPDAPAGSARLGLAAIEAADAVLVPALAVAADGTRLGRGGGSYDRALTRVGARAVTAALLFDGETVAALPRDGWDVPVTDVVTPTGWTAIARNTASRPDR